MSIVKNQTLSLNKQFTSGNSVEKFFKKYHTEENIECYKFFFCPLGGGTDVNDLFNINYKEKIVFWINCDSFIDFRPFNWYEDQYIKPICELEKICEQHPDKIFIIFSWQHGLNKFIKAKNLYSIELINTDFKKKNRYKRCNNKIFIQKKWVCLNNSMMPHRIVLTGYLLSMGLDTQGIITAGKNYNIYYPYNYFQFDDKLEEKIKKAVGSLKIFNFEYIKLREYQDIDNLVNYHKNLMHTYKYTALEIITGSLFFEPTPFYGEKEIQAIYAKNFPIFINTKNAAYTFKDTYGFDIFEDIVDHSYDLIEDPAKRITAAIDRNIHLLNGTVDLESLWYKNQHRFEKNCDLADNLYFNQSYQFNFDEKQIKRAFDYFDIKYIKVKKSKSS